MKHLERALQGKNGIGRYIALFLIAFIGGSIIGSIPLGIVVVVKAILSGNMDSLANIDITDLSAFGISNNVSLLLMLLSFVGVFFTFALLVKPFHQRTLKETINGRNHIRWNRVWMGILVWGALLLVSFAISYFTASPEELEFRFNPSALIGLIVVVLLFMPFQTSAEEILFRGYLAQGVAKWTKSRWWALIIPSVGFALMHSANPEVKEYGFWLTMPDYFLMGLLLGLVSILDDGIELAMGMHFINNALSSVLATYDSSVLQTDALFKQTEINPVDTLIETVILGVVAVFVLQRIYKWNFGILNKKVETNMPPLPPQTKAEPAQ